VCVCAQNRGGAYPRALSPSVPLAHHLRISATHHEQSATAHGSRAKNHAQSLKPFKRHARREATSTHTRTHQNTRKRNTSQICAILVDLRGKATRQIAKHRAQCPKNDLQRAESIADEQTHRRSTKRYTRG
jgi:hypothetical protein